MEHVEHHGDEVDCADALRELYTFLDGELTVERRAVIEEHLEQCHHCIGAFDFEAELKIVIAERCREAAPPDLRQRIATALRDLRDEP